MSQGPFVCPTGHRALCSWGHVPNSRVLQGALIWVPFLGFWLLSPGDTSRSPISPARAQIRRKCEATHPILPPWAPPWLSRGKGWLKSCILSKQSTNNLRARRESGLSCPLAGSPGSPTSVMEPTEKGNSQPVGPGNRREACYYE